MDFEEFLRSDAEAKLRTKHNAELNEIETAFTTGSVGIGHALARAYLLGAHRPDNTPGKHGDTKLREKIRDAFQANYRAALNLLSSMTAEERTFALRAQEVRQPHVYAEGIAREACIATWGEEAVNAALGGGP